MLMIKDQLIRHLLCNLKYKKWGLGWGVGCGVGGYEITCFTAVEVIFLTMGATFH